MIKQNNEIYLYNYLPKKDLKDTMKYFSYIAISENKSKIIKKNSFIEHNKSHYGLYNSTLSKKSILENKKKSYFNRNFYIKYLKYSLKK